MIGFHVFRVSTPQSRGDSGKPAWEAATRHFSIDIRTGAGKQIDSRLGGGVKKRLQVEYAICAVGALVAFQKSPINIKRNCVETEGFDFLEYVEIERPDRKTRV